ncbi:hypothetical protein FIBSPDRAFT_830296 [Athelia psychrophila]|uniref:SHSP domain-containing protein n=1 Tax=Athelia psychrophila TaxID=1759441 RepID=A0A166GD62_9AGAM|nr:hypothetical protein FIBSPDRAFT_830296 [Fibularhizoctonia sp. CBS 109695]
MHVVSTASGYTLNAQLPIDIQPEMITVSAKKGDRIAVVADVWHMETDCHYEWQIQFPHDINMNSVRVIVGKGGQLTIHAPKRRQTCYGYV